MSLRRSLGALLARCRRGIPRAQAEPSPRFASQAVFLRSILTRSRTFFPRGTAVARAEHSPSITSQAAGRATRSVHTLVGDLGAGAGAFALVAGSIGFAAGLLASKTLASNDSAGDAADVAVSRKPGDSGNITLEEVYEDVEAGFERWMKKNKRSYKDEEEKAKRFQIFKENLKVIESFGSKVSGINCFADRTWEEKRQTCSGHDAELETIRRFMQEMDKEVGLSEFVRAQSERRRSTHSRT